MIISNCYLHYSKEKQNSVQTNCRINQILTQQIIHPKSIGSNNEMKLCKNTSYGIIYENNSFVLVGQPPIRLSPNDLRKLHKILMTSLG